MLAGAIRHRKKLQAAGSVSPLALLTTTTRAVHHRYITKTALGTVWRKRPSSQNPMVEPKMAAA
jgi:hypothetical protein